MKTFEGWWGVWDRNQTYSLMSRAAAEAAYKAGVDEATKEERERCADKVERLGNLMSPEILADRLREG